MTQAQNKLIKEWKRRARVLFVGAKRAKSKSDKQRLEFGAMINLNCAEELEQTTKSS